MGRSFECKGYSDSDDWRHNCCSLNMKLCLPPCDTECAMDKSKAVSLNELKQELQSRSGEDDVGQPLEGLT